MLRWEGDWYGFRALALSLSLSLSRARLASCGLWCAFGSNDTDTTAVASMREAAIREREGLPVSVSLRQVTERHFYAW